MSKPNAKRAHSTGSPMTKNPVAWRPLMSWRRHWGLAEIRLMALCRAAAFQRCASADAG